MPVIAIISQKGGVGKTTLTIHLAAAAHAAGYVSLIIDMDQQASAAVWSKWRKGNSPEVITVPPTLLEDRIDGAKEAGAQFIFIDTPPNADLAALKAAAVADLILIPVRPRAFDLHAMRTTASLTDRVPGKAWAVLNGVPAGARRLVADAEADITNKVRLPICPHRLTERKVFRNAPGDGKVAAEAEPTGKGSHEIEILWNWLCGHVGMSPCRQARKRAPKKEAAL